MPLYGENSAVVRGVVLWDGFTKPEDKRNDKTGEVFKEWTISIALVNNDPELNNLEKLLNDEFFKGDLKKYGSKAALQAAGGHWGIKAVDPTKYEGALPYHVTIKAVSYQIKQLYDANRNELSPMQYANLLYPGATIDLLVTPRTYNNVSKGVGFWLGGIMVVDTSTPRLPVGGIDAAAAFGSVAMPPAAAPAYAPPAAAPAYAPPAAAPAYAPPAAAPAYAPPAAAPGIPGAIPPNPAFLQPPPAPVRQMTAAANGATYEAMIKAGWTDALLVQHGMMLP